MAFVVTNVVSPLRHLFVTDAMEKVPFDTRVRARVSHATAAGEYSAALMQKFIRLQG